MDIESVGLVLSGHRVCLFIVEFFGLVLGSCHRVCRSSAKVDIDSVGLVLGC